MKSILIAGTNSGCGKTTIALGLMAVLSEKYKVQPFKVGPDYIDTAYHTFITRRNSSNLDGWMLTEREVTNLFIKNSRDADISIVEGVMGAYDGFGIERDNNGSSTNIAKDLKIPTILVINGKAMALSAAALVKGFIEFDSEINWAGIIINNIMGEKHYRLLKDSIEKYTNVPVLGYLSVNKGFQLPSRHLGLIPSHEMKDIKEKIELLKVEIKKTINIEKILKLSETSFYIDKHYLTEEPIVKKPVKVGIAKDKAFNFYYKDSLELLKELGAELVEFSPLTDNRLPNNLDALYFGGGFPEVFAEELEANKEIQVSILKALEQGMPYLAECGGLMYLAKSIKNFDGKINQMLGWFNFDCEMTKRLQRFGYNELSLKQDSMLGKKGATIRTHEFHRSKIVNDKNIDTLFSISKKTYYDTKQWECGYIKSNGTAGYPHFHFYANRNFAKSFIKAAENYRKRK